MNTLILVIIGLIKIAATAFFLALPWYAWKKETHLRAGVLAVISVGTTAFLW